MQEKEVSKMSNRLFQGIVHQMKDAIDRTIGVIDETSVVIACSELGKIGEVNESINSETLSSTAPFVINGYTYKSFGSSAKYDYAVFVQGTDEYAQKYAQLLSVSFASIKQYYDEKYDRGNFIKNVILDNILPGDIYLKSRELRFNADVTRVCLLIKISSKTDISAYDTIFIMSPIYWGTYAPEVETALKELDFSGKTVRVISTQEGSGLGNMVSDVKKICKGANVDSNGLAIVGSKAGGSKDKIAEWL